MRANRIALVALLVSGVLTVGLVVVVADRGETCADVFAPTDSRLRHSEPSVATEHLRPNADAGLDEVRWVLSTSETDTRDAVIDVGRWTAYLDRTEISRIDDDGAILWTRSVPRARTVHLDPTHLGLLAFVDGRFHLAIVDERGRLTRCDDLFDTNANVAPDESGGYLTAGGATDDAASDLVRRIEADGSERWRTELSPPAGATLAEVFVGSGVAVVGQTDGDREVVLTVLDDESGSLRWELAGSAEIGRVRSIVGVLDELVYVIVDDGRGERSYLAAIDLGSGEVRWELEGGVGSLLDGRARRAGELVVIESSTTAHAIDPATGETAWITSTNAISLGGPDAGRAVAAGDDLLVAVGRDGALIDLSDGAAAQLFLTNEIISVESVAVSDRVMIADVAILDGPENEPATFVAAWSFDPAAAALTVTANPLSTAARPGAAGGR